MANTDNVIAILNGIRSNASTEYQTSIPEATRTNIASIKNALTTWDIHYNTLITSLFGLIGHQQLKRAMYENPLKRFKKAEITDYKDQEEIFEEMAQSAQAFNNDAGASVLARYNQDNTKTAFHRVNRQDTYVMSIDHIAFLNCFTSWERVQQFISNKLNSIYTRDEYDEFLLMKNALATHDGYYSQQVSPITDEATARAFVETVRMKVNDLQFMNNLHNKQGVKRVTKPDNLVLFINKDVDVLVGTRLLASAFNRGDVTINVPQIMLDDFGSLENTYAILASKEFFQVWDNLNIMKTQDNNMSLFTNYILHHHQTISTSPFEDAIRFTTADATA